MRREVEGREGREESEERGRDGEISGRRNAGKEWPDRLSCCNRDRDIRGVGEREEGSKEGRKV